MTIPEKLITRRFFSLVLLTLMSFSVIGDPLVSTVKLPYGGIRPQAAIDASGIIHIVQSESAKRGDLVYLKFDPETKEFSKPIPVLNTAKGMAAGFNMTVSSDGRVHVIIRPNPRYSKLAMGVNAYDEMFNSKQRFFVLRYMLHTRLNDEGTAFETEKNIIGKTMGFEGVGSVVAEPDSKIVYAFWAGQLKPGPEMERDMYMAFSQNEGRDWSEPKKLSVDIQGNCRCCPIHASMDQRGHLFVVYRNSVKTSPTSWNKNTYVLKSTNKGKTWTKKLIQKWENCGCPGAIYSMSHSTTRTLVGFRTRGISSFADANDPSFIIQAPNSGNASSRPIVSTNKNGEIVFCWIEGQDVVWQAYNKDGRVMKNLKGRLKGKAAKWSNGSLVATARNNFILFYDDSYHKSR